MVTRSSTVRDLLDQADAERIAGRGEAAARLYDEAASQFRDADDLAGWTGSSREAVGKALHVLRGRAWITTARRCVTVLDLEGLRSRAT